MKRTQLYLDEDIWKVLRIRSRQRRTTISDLVRQAIRDCYGSSPSNRTTAMQALVGLRQDRSDLPDTQKYVRQLRKGKRLTRIVS